MNRTIRALAFALAVTAAPAFAQEPAPPAPVPAPDLGKLGAAQAAQANLAVGVDEARTRVVKAVGWLLANQHPDGSWGAGAMDSVQFTNFSVETYFAFQYAANSLGFLALLAVDATPERDAAATKALEWLLTARVAKRGSDWDVDCSWAALYGFQAMVAAASDPRFQTEAHWERVAKRGQELYTLLEQNQEPLGGWGYYEGPVVSQRPTWSTSFATACVIPSLVKARGLEWKVDAAVLERAVKYVERCKLPGGACMYDLRPIPRRPGESIDNVKGSLGRMQVSNWALRRAGRAQVTDEVLREALASFFEHHQFLDVARMRPVPHEAYYANAAYFYMFAHCYAAQAINELPEAERPEWHRRLRAHLAKIQWEDGSSLDFPNMSCMQTAGTAFSILAFQAGLPGAKAIL
ncbi:MAG: hypothetical protein NTV21_14110 [Planctomycetota bacterium]|nr:hypothetical protein [Planctomycetota bacterium]